MKTIAADAMTAIEAGEAIVTGAVTITPPTGDPLRLWGGYGSITPPSIGETFTGLGNQALAQQTAGAIGGVAQGMKLTLSGIDPEALALLEVDEINKASVVIYRFIFASDGRTLLDAHVFDRGRIDTVDSNEVIGGEASIECMVETAARGLGRSGARMRADSDQRLIDATDGYFKHTAYAMEKMLYWGGKKPERAGDSLGSRMDR